MEKYIRTNYILLFLDTVIFINAMTFLSINTVIPYFLNTLGAGTFQISLASALVGIGTFISQPIFAKKAMESVHKLKTFVKILSLQRFFFLGFVFTIPVFAVSKPHLMTIIFLICWGIFSFFIGSYSPFYMSLFSKMVPDRQRGRMIGFSNAIANVIALGTAYIVGILLKQVAFPLNYTLVFGLGTLLLLMDNVDFLLMKEPSDAHGEEDISFFQYIKSVPDILKSNKKFVKLVSGYSLIVMSNVSLVYYTLYAIREFNAKAGEISLFMIIAVAVNTLANIFFGLLSDRYGHRLVLQIASVSAVLAGAVILGVHSIYAVYAAFTLSNLCSCGYFVSSGVLIIQNCPQKQVPVYIGINAMITLVISSFVTLFSSFIIDISSFKPIFLITGIAGLGAFVVFYLYGKTYKTYTENLEKECVGILKIE